MNEKERENKVMCKKLRALAITIFKQNLQCFYIAGSRAKNDFTQSSDLDFFILLQKPNRKAEYQFAQEFKKLSNTYKLPVDHVGEIVDVKTLAVLMRYANLIDEKFFISPCYLLECEWSILRKANIICGFLAHPKKYLYTKRNTIFRYMPLAKKVKRMKSALVKTIPRKHTRENFEKLVSSPLGISLYKYFRKSKYHRHK